MNAQQAKQERQLVKAGGTINVFVWLVASVVMLFSAFAGAKLLASHGVPWALGLLGGLAVDAALVVALIGDRQLHRYGQRAGWGTALRWATAVMSLVLNCGQSAEHGDWIATGLHAIFPVLLVILTEASQGYQLAFSRAVSEKQAVSESEQPAVPNTDPGHVFRTTSQPHQHVAQPGMSQQEQAAAVPAQKLQSSGSAHSRAKPSTPARKPARSTSDRSRSPLTKEEQWERAVQLVASYQREEDRNPTLREFHTGLRMSRNAASPLRNSAIAAVAQHGAKAAKQLSQPGENEQESGSNSAESRVDTDAQVVDLPSAHTAGQASRNTDSHAEPNTAEFAHAR